MSAVWTGTAAALLVAQLVGPVAASASGSSLSSLGEAGDAVSVQGRVVGDHRRPGEAPVPRPDAGIVLLPWDGVLVAQLEEIRRRARQDARAYARSAQAIDEAIRAHGAGLEARGLGGSIRFARSGADGGFVLHAVSPGRWVLVARLGVVTTRYSGSHKRKEQAHFQVSPRLTGYRAVDVWLWKLEVGTGSPENIDLSARNVWMTAIEEERAADAGLPAGVRGP